MRSFPPKKVAGGKTVLFFYDTEGHLVAEVEKVAASDDAARLYVFLEDELIGIVDETEEVGSVRTPIPIPIDLSLPLALLALFAGAGLLVLLVTRRAPLGIATTTSGAALLLLCAQTSGGPLFAWVHVDPLGTPLAVTAGDPAVAVWRASYEPFGKATVSEDPDGDTETFSLAVRLPGQYEDAETGRHYNMFRYYDPTVGRYLNADPLGPYGLMLSQLAVPDDPASDLLLPSPLVLPSSDSDPDIDLIAGRDDITIPLRGVGMLELNSLLGTRASSAIDGNVFSYVVNLPTNLVDPRGQFGSLGLRFAARALGRAAAAARAFARNLQFDGPQGTRIRQIRYRRLPVVRLDFGPYPGTGGEPRLHLHLPRLFPNTHIPLDPRRLRD